MERLASVFHGVLVTSEARVRSQAQGRYKQRSIRQSKTHIEPALQLAMTR